MKVSELTGMELDQAVAKAMGYGDRALVPDEHLGERRATGWKVFNPSQNWEQGGPIVERERIGFEPMESGKWFAAVRPEYSGPERIGAAAYASGPTPLVAAMRAYVASKFDQEVPDD